jgi:hypothetical protein
VLYCLSFSLSLAVGYKKSMAFEKPPKGPGYRSRTLYERKVYYKGIRSPQGAVVSACIGAENSTWVGLQEVTDEVGIYRCAMKINV